MASEKITAIIEELKGLTVLELSELVHAVEDEFGVSAAAAVAVAGPAADGGAAAVRGHPAAGHRCVDGHAGSLHSGYEIQGCIDRLHGRCAAGGHHHGLGKRRAAGCAQRAVCGRLTKRGRFCREKCR